MSTATPTELEAVVSLWRYPVKSMLGEEVQTAQVTDHGLLGDRAYALLDRADGKVATAKNPRKWPSLFAFQATFVEPSGRNTRLPPVRITLPDGTSVTSAQRECHQVLSTALHREVTLAATAHGQVAGVSSSMPASWTAQAEEYWPDMAGLDHRDTVTDFALPPGTFFDCATVHLLTTATLHRLRECYPHGRFEVQRFRPNIVVDPVGGEQGFVEDAWIGHTLATGDEVRLRITGSCGSPSRMRSLKSIERPLKPMWAMCVSSLKSAHSRWGRSSRGRSGEVRYVVGPKGKADESGGVQGLSGPHRPADRPGVERDADTVLEDRSGREQGNNR